MAHEDEMIDDDSYDNDLNVIEVRHLFVFLKRINCFCPSGNTNRSYSITKIQSIINKD
jgi:hypothetical protein